MCELMITKVHHLNENQVDQALIEEAGEVIRAGGLVAFPTETVYGLGADAFNPKASEKIYAAKGRPSDNPLIVHICDLSMLNDLSDEIPENAMLLAKAFWPGPLTMILAKKACVPKETTGGLDTVAVRMPKNRIALELIRAAGTGIAAPSANLSGRPSPTKASHVKEDLSGRIDMILDGGDCPIGIESTIVDLTSDVPMILRPGYFSKEMLENVIGRVEYDPALCMVTDQKVKPKAPGMKYRHYSPKGELTIVTGEKEAVRNYINAQIKGLPEGVRSGVIATEETCAGYTADLVQNIGSLEDEETIARRLYNILRTFDARQIDRIYSEAFYEGRMGEAVMNRLIKAAGHHIIEV
jgi:L-threonylcarbamoyladenylate synthase